MGIQPQSQDYLSTCMHIPFIILFLNKLLDSLAFYFLSTKIFYGLYFYKGFYIAD